MLVLGIESSCDETAAALLDERTGLLSSIVASQVDLHHRYGGVVPELASREHLKNIRIVVELALQEAVACPHCGSKDTVLDNPFGPTLCQSLHFCRACQQSFQRFKPL